MVKTTDCSSIRMAGRRIARSEQQISALIDVFALLDTAPHATNEDIVTNQDRKGRIEPELLTERQCGDFDPS